MLHTLDDGSAEGRAASTATWCDIDTIEDLHNAESLLDGGREPAAAAKLWT